MKNLVFELISGLNIHFLIARIKRVVYPNQVTVLCLHRIHPVTNPFWPPIHPDVFAEFLVYLKENYDVIGFRDLHSYKQARKPPIILSFDDGYKDFVDYALPLLAQHQLKCNHNIVIQCAEQNTPTWTQFLVDLFSWIKEIGWSGQLPIAFGEPINIDAHSNLNKLFLNTLRRLFDVNQAARLLAMEHWQDIIQMPLFDHDYMNWNDVMYCHNQGVEIGCHTWTHDVLALETDESVLEKELHLSKVKIEQQLGCIIDVLALPNGQANDVVLKYAKKVGYKQILLVGDRYLTHPHESIIPRINMVNEPIHAMYSRILGVHASLRKLQIL